MDSGVRRNDGTLHFYADSLQWYFSILNIPYVSFFIPVYNFSQIESHGFPAFSGIFLDRAFRFLINE